MARQGVTFEQVAACADALAGEGMQPTIRAVRERLGDKGSPNTIHRHLSAWRDSRPVMSGVAQDLPQALIAAISAEIDRASARSRAEIEERLVQSQAEATELASVGEALEGERDGLLDQLTALVSERDTLAGKAQQQASDLADVRQRVEREQQAAEAARVELATAKLKIEAQVERIHDLGEEMARLRLALNEAQQGRIAAEQQAAVLMAKLEAADGLVKRAERRIEQVEKQALTAEQRNESVRAEAAKELQRVRDEASRLAGELDAFQRQRGQENPGETESRGRRRPKPL